MPQPDLILTPFAQDAPPSAVDPIPESRAPSDPLEKATWTQGFPGLTMIPLAAGGIPPRGQDVNGVLKAISEHTVFQGGGGKYKWSAEYVSAKGGYPAGAVIQSDDGLSEYVSLIDGNSDNFNADPGSIGITWAPFSGSAQGGGVYTLSASGAITASKLGLVLLDASGGNRTYTLPAANSALGVREVTLRRVDVTSNALVIATSGSNKLMLDTTTEAAGQATTELLFAGDYLRLRSDGAGNWWCVGQAQLPGSISSGLVAWTEPGVSNYSVPAALRSGRRKANVTVVGAGGGFSGSATLSRGAGGGGYAYGPVDLTGVSAVTVTVGAGTSSAGGSSSFGSFMSASGGVAGAIGSGNFSAGGMGVGGSVNKRGASGGGPDGNYSGEGGASPSSVGQPRSVSGLPGAWPGGGAGAGNSAQVGAGGLVLMEW